MNTTTQQNLTTEKTALRLPEISHLDSDSQRSIRAIYKNGYYETHQTLGVGGWPIVYEFANDWRTYVLNAVHNGNEFNDTIVAKNDQSAKQAFADKYDLEDCDFVSIQEKITTYREL